MLDIPRSRNILPKSRKKNQLVKADPEVTEVIELSDKDFK